ncbi:MAG: chemotaxis protein CheW [Polyangiaceae bacterium]|nr:chemotaxis protein CheW [Polyangiaceae bacterium]
MADLTRVERRGHLRRAAQVGPIREFLAFTLAGELYAVELTTIREIVSPPPITHVPRAASDVLGICSVRGLLVTVIDLRQRLRLGDGSGSQRTRILLSETASGEVVGLLVDEVRQVIRLGASEIEPVASVLGGEISAHVQGIGRPSSDAIVLLDLGSIVGA